MPCSWSNDYCSFGLCWFHGVTSIYFLKTLLFVPIVLGEPEESWVIHYFLKGSSSDIQTLSEGRGWVTKRSPSYWQIFRTVSFSWIWHEVERAIRYSTCSSPLAPTTKSSWLKSSIFSTQVYNSSPSCCWNFRLVFVVVVRNKLLLWNDMTNSQTSWQVEHFSYIHFHWHLYVFIDLISSFCLNVMKRKIWLLMIIVVCPFRMTTMMYHQWFFIHYLPSK